MQPLFLLFMLPKARVRRPNKYVAVESDLKNPFDNNARLSKYPRVTHDH